MSESSTGRVRRWIVGAVLAAALPSVVPATITDDITPFGSVVAVGLRSTSSNVRSGTVVVTVVQADGQTATSSASFRVESGAKASVTVSFASQVAKIEAVSIIED